jgi:hypothetical protein
MENPSVHPQKEDYWGNVNPIGPRSCYDEGKRGAETLFLITGGNTNCASRSRASSIHTGRACIRMMGGLCQTLLSKRCTDGTSPYMATVSKRDRSVMWMISLMVWCASCRRRMRSWDRSILETRRVLHTVARPSYCRPDRITFPHHSSSFTTR